jgi:hypothetical protein
MQARIGQIEQLKQKLRAVILRSIKGASVRQAAAITGLRPITISRLRRGLDRDYSLEGLIRAAMNIGISIDIHVGDQVPTVLWGEGREGTRRPR